MFQENKARRQILRKKEHFLPPEGKTCSFFRKIWHALFSWNTPFEVRAFALLPSNYNTQYLWSVVLRRADFREIPGRCVKRFERKGSWFESKVSSFEDIVFHLSFWTILLPFCQIKVPSFYLNEEPVFRNNLIQFFILNKQFLNFSYFLFEIFLSHISHRMK